MPIIMALKKSSETKIERADNSLLIQLIRLPDERINDFYSKIEHYPKRKRNQKRKMAENPTSDDTTSKLFTDETVDALSMEAFNWEMDDIPDSSFGSTKTIIVKQPAENPSDMVVSEIVQPENVNWQDTWENPLLDSAVEIERSNAVDDETTSRAKPRIISNQRVTNYILPPPMVVNLQKKRRNDDLENDKVSCELPATKRVAIAYKRPADRGDNSENGAAATTTNQPADGSGAVEVEACLTEQQMFDNWNESEKLAGLEVPEIDFEDIDIGKITLDIEQLLEFIGNKERFTLGDLLSVAVKTGKRLTRREIAFIDNILTLDVPTFIGQYLSLFQNISSEYSTKADKLIELCALTSATIFRSNLPRDCGCMGVSLRIDKSQWVKRSYNFNPNVSGSLYHLTPNLTKQCYRLAQKFQFNDMFQKDFCPNDIRSTNEDPDNIRLYSVETVKLTLLSFLSVYGKLAILESRLFPANIVNL